MIQKAETRQGLTGGSQEVSCADSGGTADSVAPPGTAAGDIAALWAEAQVTSLLRAPGEPVPAYGSMEWLDLEPGDPRKVAALITAAEEQRRRTAEEARLNQLAIGDPEEYFHQVTADADAYAAGVAPALAHQLAVDELRRAAPRQPVREVVATAGWPPIAIPGRPGWYRHLIDGQQVDLPTNAPQKGQDARD